MTYELEEKLIRYTGEGGTLVLTMRTGVMDKNNKCMDEYALPGRLGEMLGLEIEEYDSLYDNKEVILHMKDGKSSLGKHWCDVIQLHGAESFMTYGSEYYKGKPAVCVHSFEKGTAWYIGTDPDAEGQKKILNALLQRAGMNYNRKEKIETVIRNGRQKDYLFVMNHSEEKQHIRVGKKWGEDEVLELEPYGVRILEKSRKNKI